MESCNPPLWEKWLVCFERNVLRETGIECLKEYMPAVDIRNWAMQMWRVYIPLCCKLAAGLGSEGREASGQEEVVEELILQRAMFQEMKAMQQQEEEEEEEGRALLGKKNSLSFQWALKFRMRLIWNPTKYTKIYSVYIHAHTNTDTSNNEKTIK